MTRLQLRRLALQATRRPELLPVLQDALLESAEYGRLFEQAIAIAREDARHDENTGFIAQVVSFKIASSRSPFAVQGFRPSDFALDNSRGWLRILASCDEVPVYHVPIRRRRQR